MTAEGALRGAIPRLRSAGIEDAASDARRLLAHALGIAPDRLTLVLPDEMTPLQVAAYEKALQARESRRPVAQITGQRLFWGRPFRVTADTLDPRPETETLVAEALRAPFTSVLDLGTGTGVLLVTLLAERQMASGVGTDLSPAALAVARANAESLGVVPRARFAIADWLDGIEGRFDLVVSNPPYIAASEMPGLAPEVRDHEPRLALTDEADGMAAYRALAAGVPSHLAPGGRLLLEIGPTQGRAVAAMLAAVGLTDIHILPDLDGRDRVVAARMPG
ncbi:peptide chain release factor N(5)-glutamine methyltransferase [Rhodobacter sp. Har01]|uniref:peptide chain release factor N(5)-glutamine methyltransferase n=1 Tax=Rhodobacter sp. Har01 TaxID=2883999 RepID=UPI001D064966|nr:peptide chain release factor N(5)-glutamine methyltransferase [Rhodobacter sp. Har01]MCB6177294.1 peptide chain release factor N(5)-glutamine methyltransferase [Rhodobacter sp. Har01]